ncbi:hypothetical protein [Microvirga tunisiensis]|uniref:Uncharacterized protein n=1 Tax=Microvirga tunisiensis TaxID=2108360 RepID=A0A5N7MAE5_9HYPH|nr:hypothetical protein [Microvirga tunisiensis]MPR05516.1 hypothetical protein [Microvirga tunisiensis]MPR23717.1 hypothetical protein [Microvirga tunisiensis]
MHRAKYRDIPAYADDVISFAKPVRSQLVLGAGLLSMLMIAMSAVEAPMLHQGTYISQSSEDGGPAQGISWLMCMFGEKPTS